MVSRRELLLTTVAAGLVSTTSRSGAQAARPSLVTLEDGAFTLPVGSGSAGRDPAEIRAALAQHGLPTDSIATVLNVTALRTRDGLVLIDCGAGKNFVPGTGRLMERLEQAGIAADDVVRVVFTHAHPDHLWGALDDFDMPAFPKASYHLPAAEWDYWFDEGIYRSLPEDRHSFAAGAQRILKALEPVTQRFKPGDEPAPGILALDAAGHTPGHVALLTITDRGPTLIAGDAATHPVISFRHPDWAGGFDVDREKASVTRRRLLEQAVSERLTIVGYHLPNGGIGRVERDGAAYRFVQ